MTQSLCTCCGGKYPCEKKVLSAEKIAELQTPNPRFKYTTAIHVVIADVLDSHEKLRRQLEDQKGWTEAAENAFTSADNAHTVASAWSRRWKRAARNYCAIANIEAKEADAVRAKLAAAEAVVEAVKACQGELMHVPFIGRVFDAVMAYDAQRGRG